MSDDEAHFLIISVWGASTNDADLFWIFSKQFSKIGFGDFWQKDIWLSKFEVGAKISITFVLLFVRFWGAQLSKHESCLTFHNESNVEIPEMNKSFLKVLIFAKSMGVFANVKYFLIATKFHLKHF